MRKEHSVGKEKASNLAAGQSHGRGAPHHVGVIPACLISPYGQYLKSWQSFQKHSAPACAASESWFVWKEVIEAIITWMLLGGLGVV